MEAVVKSQFLRALKVSSDQINAMHSMDMIHALFRLNGYPPQWLNEVARQAAQQHNNRHSKRTAKRPLKDRIYVTLPFIDDTLTRSVDAVLRSINPILTASWKNSNTIQKRLVHSALEPPQCRAGKRSCRTCDSGLTGRCTTKNVVYQIKCIICAELGGPPQIYIGETKRCIRYRFDEHFRDGVNHIPQTPFGDHMLQCHPNVAEPRMSVAIIRRCKDAADRKIAEALAIRDRRPGLNNQMDTWPVLE